MNSLENYKYQLVMLGDSTCYDALRAKLLCHFESLGMSSNLLGVCKWDEVDARMPVVGVYFGDEADKMKDAEAVDILLKKKIAILPVVKTIAQFRNSVPPVLAPINGMELKLKNDIDRLANFILEEFQLLRKKRKIFISYCRGEASNPTHQLYNHLAHRLYDELVHQGFVPFLDTYTIGKGVDFQDELCQYLADADMMILLHTPDCMARRWVRAELAEAARLQIGVLEVRWHGNGTYGYDKWGNLSYPLFLKECEVKPCTINKACQSILEAVQHWRAANLRPRTANLTSSFLNFLDRHNHVYRMHLSHVIMTNIGGKQLIYFPLLGAPDAKAYDEVRTWITQHIEIRNKYEVRVIYDSLYLKNDWLNHLQWLDVFLPVKSVNVREFEGSELEIEEKQLKKIFLSASIPLAQRNRCYYETADVIAIRDAVRALAASVLPKVCLVWGGHPSITPLIRSVLRQMNVEVKTHVELYQSEYFVGVYPSDNECIERIRLVSKVQHEDENEARKASIRKMREEMLSSEHHYAAGIFIGGMEGVEEEFTLFKENHPTALLIPVASTGAAARNLFNSVERTECKRVPEGFDCQRLMEDYDYLSLFEDLFKAII